MEDVSHHHDVCLGKRRIKKAAGMESHTRCESVGGYIVFENRTYFRQIESGSGDMRICKRQL